MSDKRQRILLSQVVQALHTALGGAEVRVFGQEPDQLFGVVLSQDDDGDFRLKTTQIFHEKIDGQLHKVLYTTVVLVGVLRDDLGPVR